MLGLVDYMIREDATGRVLADERRTFYREDLLVQSVAEGAMQRLEFRLAYPFRFGLARAFSPELAGHLSGFGLTADRDDEETFSWEWFNVVDLTEAIKLQEGGHLRIETVTGPQATEVVRTEFLTDVSLRIVRSGQQAPFPPFWRIEVRQGSWVNWPASIDL